MSVKGMTEPSKTPATTHHKAAPGKPCCDGAQQTQSCQDGLHDTGSAIAGREFSRSYFYSAFHSGRIFNEAYVDSGSCEQAAREHGTDLSNLTHHKIWQAGITQSRILAEDDQPAPSNLRCGLRSRLLLKDFDWGEEMFIVSHAKGGGSQRYPLQRETGDAILEQNHELLEGPDDKVIDSVL